MANGFSRVSLAALAVLGVVACDAPLFGGRPPSDSVTVDVDLAPGETGTYLFDIEAEVFGVREWISVRMHPSESSLAAQGIRVDRSWTRDDIEEDGWPEPPEDVAVDRGTPLIGLLRLTLTNESESSVEMQVTVLIQAGVVLPQPSEDTLRVGITRR